MSNKIFKHTAVIICLLLGMPGCSSAPEKPENLIPEDQYVKLLIEKQLVRTYIEYSKGDSTEVDSLANAIHEQYDITEPQFQKSHQYYLQSPKEQKKRVDQAIEQLRQELVTKPDSAASDTSTAVKKSQQVKDDSTTSNKE